MILATVGTNEAPFDRLIAALDGVAGPEELVVQHGPSGVRPGGARCLDYLSFDELSELAAQARVVVTHAGVGSIMTALGAGKRPVVMARLGRLGEAVDDHQLPLAGRMHSAGLVTLVHTREELVEAVRGGSASAPPPAGDGALARELRGYLLAQGLRPREPGAAT